MDLQKTKIDAHQMFNRISKTYDVLNTILSIGLHHRWRKCPLKWLEKERPIFYLDLASGTCDQLITMMDKMPNIQRAYAVDPAEAMLEIGKKKVLRRAYKNKVDWIVSSADALPFEDETFDFSTMTFGLRNLSDMQKGIKELHRVTKLSGQVHIIEFGKPTGMIAPFYRFYLKGIVPFIGKLFSQDATAYHYLCQSIQSFEDNNEVARLLFESGFQSVFCEKTFFGLINHFIAIR